VARQEPNPAITSSFEGARIVVMFNHELPTGRAEVLSVKGGAGAYGGQSF
jgi:hypothetical protein